MPPENRAMTQSHLNRDVSLYRLYLGAAVKSWKVALVVGTLLTFIHEGPVLLGEGMEALHPFRIVLNYLVPLAVSAHARVRQSLAPDQSC